MKWEPVSDMHGFGVAVRAAQLKAFLDSAAPDEPVHLIAYSLGGLDSRYYISRLGGARRVLSLTTIGTPHRGTPVADWVVAHVGPAARPVCNLLGVAVEAFDDLTTARCRALSAQMPGAPGVRYFSVAGRFEPNLAQPEWEPSRRLVWAAEGDSDGIVSLASATHGESVDIWPGDHLSLVNWNSVPALWTGAARDRRADYAALVNRLRDLGF